jgi:hypothetical protein
MNIQLFKKHYASRKIVCRPLQTGSVPIALPKHYSEGEKTFLLDTGRVLHVDLTKSNQCVILDLDEKSKQWLQGNYELEGTDIRLSRFKRAYGGMMNPPIRIWEKTESGYVKYEGNITRGCLVKCGCTPTKSKGKTYFELHRDIVLVDKPVQTKRKKVEYFSDEES